VAAGSLLLAVLVRNPVHQHAIAARTRILFAIVVHASGRILENELGPPGLAWRTPIATLLHELQLELQDVQEVSLISMHARLLDVRYHYPRPSIELL
jgi:hypothetical protein